MLFRSLPAALPENLVQTFHTVSYLISSYSSTVSALRRPYQGMKFHLQTAQLNFHSGHLRSETVIKFPSIPVPSLHYGALIGNEISSAKCAAEFSFRAHSFRDCYKISFYSSTVSALRCPCTHHPHSILPPAADRLPLLFLHPGDHPDRKSVV